ncbi:MAG: APC family permease [Actinomycetales bacterium]|nr:APC family permease [Actinomycetales bacterium]
MPLTDVVKRLVVGRALRSERVADTLLPKRIALPVFASDALSSNAYATQEILIVLALGGTSLFAYGPWVAAAVVTVFFIVIASYRQNVRAYPSGGGDYEVVSTNLGPRAGVFVASALLIDYVLTVAVSISAAVANLGSTIPLIEEHSVWWAVGAILAITALNLRGVRESGSLFAIPTYAFMVCIFGLLIWAVVQEAMGVDLRAESADWTINPQSGFTDLAGFALIFLVARAFSSGTTALTGIEAIANGVPSFRQPKSKNAATTLLLLGVISMTMFVGITWLALVTGVKITDSNDQLVGLPPGQEQKTVIVQVAAAVFPQVPVIVLVIAVATALILALAANTAFNGFPVLGSILAKDGYLPRQLHTRGDRLAYSNGILALSAMAIALVVIYQADTTALIQLYIIGVFVSFTFSQIGMVRHWTRLLRTETRARGPMIRARIINTIGLTLTGTVLVIVLLTKFTRGAWIVVIAMPLIYLLMQAIHKHYERVRNELLSGDAERMILPARVHAIVLVSKVHKPTMRALAYARATRPTVLEALTVNVDPPETQRLQEDWERREIPVPLKVLASPYREITRPVVQYVKEVRSGRPLDLVTVFIPEYVVGHWWEQLLHNQSALRLKSRLLFTPGVMVTSVPWQLDSSAAAADRDD